MRIYADVLMRPMDRATRFPTVEDAVDHFASRMSVETPRQREVLRDYFCKHLIPQEGGLPLPGDRRMLRYSGRSGDSRIIFFAFEATA